MEIFKLCIEGLYTMDLYNVECVMQCFSGYKDGSPFPDTKI